LSGEGTLRSIQSCFFDSCPKNERSVFAYGATVVCFLVLRSKRRPCFRLCSGPSL